MSCCGQGAAYQLAERARGGEDAAVEVMCGALLGAAEETGLRGLHGCAEHRMRAAHYGLGAAGSVKLPSWGSARGGISASPKWPN